MSYPPAPGQHAYPQQPYPQPSHPPPGAYGSYQPGPYGYPAYQPSPPPGNWGLRAVALLVDLAIGFAVFFAVGFGGAMGTVAVLEPTAPEFLASETGMFLSFSWIFLALLLWLGYFSVSHSRSGQTLGKRLMGIKVVSLRTGEPPSLGAAAGRIGIYLLLSFLPGGQLLDVLWPLWDKPYEQALHDKVAGTRVIAAPGR